MRHSLTRIAAVGMALAFSCAQAHALCNAFLHPLRTVGDTATDAACTDNDIQSAINNADPACTTDIAITREHIWNNQHLTVSGKSLNFVGQADGVGCSQVIACGVFSPCPSGPVTTLNAGGSGRVLTISGPSYVALGGLTITGGNTSGNGGGISFDGSGALTIYASSIVNNTAANGGGIDVNGSGSGARLTLQSNTLIVSNTANGSGGGIRVEGNARLFTLLPQTLIGYNHAPNGYGGGVQVVAPATADIGSPGYGNGGVIFFNDAQYGGGLSLQATSSSSVLARLFDVDPVAPARLSQNFATHSGGAVHLKPASGTVTDFGGQATLCAYGARLDGNAAQEGAAIYGDTDHSAVYETQSSYLEFARTDADTDVYCESAEPIADLGAVACAPGAGCNQIDGNAAQDSGGNVTAGSTILLQNQGHLLATALALRDNRGGSALHAFDAAMKVSNCVVVDGNYSGAPFKFDNQGEIVGGADTEHLQNCTFANNTIGGGNAVIASAHGLTLLDSIVAQPGTHTLDYTAPANQLAANYVLSNDLSTLPVSTGVVQGTPTFVDASHADYHLAKSSLGLDFAPPVSGDDRDLDGLPHDQDLPSVANQYGVRDLGAYERQLRYCGAADTFFCDDFELH
jgi:hypothetical protein